MCIRDRGWGLSMASVALSIDQSVNSSTSDERFVSGMDLFMNTLGLTPWGMPSSAIYSITEPIRNMWINEVIAPQVKEIMQRGGSSYDMGWMMIGTQPFK